MSVLKNIEQQIKRQGMTDNNRIVLKLYNSLIKNKFSSEHAFFTFVRVEFEKYGAHSYQSHKNYYLKAEFQDFVSDMYNCLVWGE